MFNKDETEVIYKLAESVTGTSQTAKNRHSIIISNVWRRMQELGINHLTKYLNLVELKEEEFDYLVSALTIHTTSWFRESPHYERLIPQIREFMRKNSRPFRVLSAACSTGQEAYSIALKFSEFRLLHPSFEYQIVGRDIDPISVQKAKNCIYDKAEISQLPENYRKHLLQGTGKTANYFTLKKDIRNRTKWLVGSLTEIDLPEHEKFDLIFCRNVLIYFEPDVVDTIIKNLSKFLTDQGVLCLGHSEAVDAKRLNLNGIGNSCYTNITTPISDTKESSLKESPEKNIETPLEAKKKDILIVDDSATVRKLVAGILKADDFNVFEVESAKDATEFLKKRSVDLITLDLHMPGEDGQTWLKAQRAKGMRVPVVILTGASSQEALEVIGAMENGAQDYIDKQLLKTSKDDFILRIKALTQTKKNTNKENSGVINKKNIKDHIFFPDYILLGASTGGTEVLAKFLTALPSNCPPVFVAQHITKAFAKPFAERLAGVSGLKLGEVVNGSQIQQRTLYMAHDDHHVGITVKAGSVYLQISNADPVNKHRPSVDFLFKSGSQLNNKKIFAALFTGMGADGAKGLLDLKVKGALTCTQDEQSSVVYGMPKEAVKLDASMFIGTPQDIRDVLNRCLAKG
jgi:two-component system, chemotaxis family, protein-glutamate methylesterase/glutaminase